MNRIRKFYKILCVLFVLILVLSSCSTSEKSFRFVFMADIHLQPERRGIEGFEAAIEAVNNLSPKPDFVITGGDLIMDALKVSYGRADSLYQHYLQACEKLDMPVYHCIGNHEVFGVYKEARIPSDHPEYAKAMFLKKMKQDKTYQSFDHKGWHFVLLDAIGIAEDGHYYGHVDSVQVQWLKKDLSSLDKETPVVLAMHIPLVSAAVQLSKGIEKPLPSTLIVDNSREVLSACGANLPRLVLQGHLHQVEEIKIKEMTFLTGGAVSGNWWKGAFHGFEEGFVVVDVKGNTFDWQFETYGWKALPEDA